ncbi:MAG: DNA uptake protein ComE-like DNA-binding protein [Rhodothermales bacterium]|jgi:DNA uptake protein ComE-like DNA-binding protein
MNKTLLFALFLGFGMLGCSSPKSETAPEAVGAASATAVDGMSQTVAQGPMNANYATVEDLAAAEGIGAGLAETIVAGRPYLRATDLAAAIASSVDADRLESVLRIAWIPLNLNDAGREEILMIPGVGDRMAHEFEEYRPYVSMAQFRREMGKYVDDAEVERLASFVFVPIDLNTATEEEILAIPGVGARMLREFREYRPYASMEQFNREIGKYVDDVELARLARYVEIRNN